MSNLKLYAEKIKRNVNEDFFDEMGTHFQPLFEPHFKSILSRSKDNLAGIIDTEPSDPRKSEALKTLREMGIEDPKLAKRTVDELEIFISLLERFENSGKPDEGDTFDLDKMKKQERRSPIYHFYPDGKGDEDDGEHWVLKLGLRSIGGNRVEITVDCRNKTKPVFNGRVYYKTGVGFTHRMQPVDEITAPGAQNKPGKREAGSITGQPAVLPEMPVDQTKSDTLPDVQTQEKETAGEISAVKPVDESVSKPVTGEEDPQPEQTTNTGPGKQEEALPASNNEIYYEKVEPGTWNRSGYVFKRRDGTPVSQDSVLKYIAQQKKLGNQEIIDDFKMHVKGKNTPGTYTSFRIDNPPKGQIHNYGYSFDPDWNKKEEEKKDDFFGSWQTSRAIVRMTDSNGEDFAGIRLHTTPTPTDTDYKSRKGNAAAVYKPGKKLTVLAKGNEKNKGWVYIQTEDGKKGWIEEHWLTPIDKGYNVNYTLHQVKKGEGAEDMLRNIKGVQRDTGYDNRTFAVAFFKMNAGNPGVSIDLKKYEKNRSLLKDIGDPWLAEARAIYQSIEVQAGAVLRVPTKKGIDELMARGELPTRPDLVNGVIKGARIVEGLLTGIPIGMYEQAKDMVTGIWDLVESIFTGEILDQLVALYEALSNMGWEDVKNFLLSMIGIDPDKFDKLWNGGNVKVETRYEYIGEIIGRLLFELILTVVTGGAKLAETLSKLPGMTKVVKVLEKIEHSVGKVKTVLPQTVMNKMKKITRTTEKAEELAAASPIFKVEKVVDTLLAPYEKLRGKLTEIQRKIGVKNYSKFDKKLRTLPTSVLKRLDEIDDPKLIEEFSKRLDDPKYYEAVKKGDLSKIDELRILDFRKLDIKRALEHVKFRDLRDGKIARRDIVGLHDAVEFYKLRVIKAIGDRNFQFPVGKTLDEVDEIVILAERNHPTIPGVKTIEYRIPNTDGKLVSKIEGFDVNKGYTTGGMKGDGAKDFVKNIYDPAIWTDAKLVKALKESLEDAFKNKSLVDGQFNGLTSEGYSIQGYIRDGKVDTFYFR